VSDGYPIGTCFSDEPGGFTHSTTLSLQNDYTIDWSIDYRISARFVTLARPTIANNNFIDKAYSTIQQLGLTGPATGWEITSWSWLVEWAINLGSSLENASYYGTQPGQNKIDYSYMTSYTRWQGIRKARELKKTTGSGSSRVTDSITSPVTSTWTICKNRQRISPFGLGIQLPSLSAGQFATLVALGLARS
jgi:hypothetical protein